MKIALIGWSGNDNWGDERMHFCTKKFFCNHTIIRFTSFLEAILNIEKINACDYLLIGGGGLIFRGFNRYAQFLSKITIPLGCIGISVEATSLNKDMKEGLEILKDKADFIYVRDIKSKKILQNHFKVIVGPDITFLYPYNEVPIVINDSCALNLRNWFWWDLELHSELHERMTRWDEKYPIIRLIYPFRRWRPDKLVGLVRRQFKELLPFPLYFGKYDKTDFKILGKYFRGITKKFDLSLLRNSRFLIGMRLHSLIFATQMGIPFISLSYEPKNVNYCSALSHPELSLPLLDYKQIERKIDYLKNNYDVIRQDLLRYTEDATKQAVHIFESIEKLMMMRSKVS